MIRVVCRDSMRILDLPFHSGDAKLTSQMGSKAISMGIGTGSETGTGRGTITGTGVGRSQSDSAYPGEIGLPPTSSHPAHLSPLLATQDTCLKILDLMTVLMDAEGCALLLTAQDSVLTGKNVLNRPGSDMPYQAVCTGTALSWYGLRPREMGTVKTPHNSRELGYSLVQTCMQQGRSIAVEDGTSDPRYSYVMDGSCLSETPFLAVPLRGRDGVCVGALMAVRRRGSAFYVQVRGAVKGCREDVVMRCMMILIGGECRAEGRREHDSYFCRNDCTDILFTVRAHPLPDIRLTPTHCTSYITYSPFQQEDILAAEMLSSYASIGLYWCQGTGSLQRRLLKKKKKVEQLEENMALLEAKLKLKLKRREG